MSLLQYNSHALVEITPSEWPSLLELYVQKKHESTGYHLIKTLSNWLAKDPQLDIKCYSLDGDWKNDGTFLMLLRRAVFENGTTFTDIFFNTLSENTKRLAAALLCVTTKPEAYKLYAYGERLIPAVNEYRKKFEKLETNHTAWYTVSKDIVQTFSAEPPAGIELRSLKLEDAATVNEIWPHRSEGSVQFVELLITHNISVGACDASGKLIAWCLRLPVGSLGMLQVLDTHKRLGLGSLMVRYMSRKISELGDEVMAAVVTENTPSRKMFEKLGFQKIDNVYWTFE